MMARAGLPRGAFRLWSFRFVSTKSDLPYAWFKLTNTITGFFAFGSFSP